MLVPDTQVEMNGGVMPVAAPFSDGVWFDPDDQRFKMWYLAGFDDGFGYAESSDGIHWVRPNLDVVPGTNRILEPIPGFCRDGATVWLDHGAVHRDERYKMFAYYRNGTGSWPRAYPEPPAKKMGNLYTSPDGVHWTLRGQTGECGDNTSFFYNPFRGTWTFSVRTNNPQAGRTRSYREQHHFLDDWSRGDLVYWAGSDEHDLPDPELHFAPELYKIDCVAYESILLGMFAVYLGPPNAEAYERKIPKCIDLYAGFSRGDLDLERPDRAPFLGCSRVPGAWDSAYLHIAGGVCLVVGDELWFYYGAWSGDSPAQGTGPYAGGSTGLAVLRRDGFASMEGPGTTMGHRAALEPGTLTTKPLRFSGRHLFVNADARPGALRVEVLDSDGHVVAPYDRASCRPVGGDSTKHRVSWEEADDVAALAGTPVRLRFSLDAGALYSFWVSPSPAGASHGYVAAGGPGFTGAIDTTGA